MKVLVRIFFNIFFLITLSVSGAQTTVADDTSSSIKLGGAKKAGVQSTRESAREIGKVAAVGKVASQEGAVAVKGALQSASEQVAQKGVAGASVDAAKSAQAASQEAVAVMVKAVQDGEVQKFQANAQKAGKKYEDKELTALDIPIIGPVVGELGPLATLFKALKISRVKVAQPELTELELSGKVNIFGALADAAILYDVIEKGAYFTIKPEQFTFRDLSDDLKVIDDQVELKKVKIILASQEFPALGYKSYKEGVNLAGTLVIKGLIKQALGMDLSLELKGFISKNPGMIDSKLSANIPTAFDLGGGVKTEKSTFGIALKRAGPALTIGSGITFPMPNQGPVTIKAEITFDTVPTGGMSIQGLVEGDWKNAFGIPFLTIKNAGLQAKKAYASNAPITEYAIKGDVVLANKKIDLVVQVKAPPVGEKSFSIIGSFEGGLGLADVTSIASQIVGENIPASTLPNLNLKDAKLYVVTDKYGAKIFWKLYPQGVYIAGDAALFGKQVHLVFMINVKKGIIGEGYLEKINVGVFTLTGDGPDKQPGTQDDGAIIDIQLTKEKQGIFISGRAELNLPGFGGVIKEAIQMSVDSKGATFSLNHDVFGFAMTFEGTLPLADINQSMLRMKGTQAALDKIRDIFNNNIDVAKKGADAAAMAAKAAADVANKQLANVKKSVDDAESQLTPFKNVEKQAKDKQAACDKIKNQFLNTGKQVSQGIQSAGKAAGGVVGNLAGAAGDAVAGAWGATGAKMFGGGSKPRVPNPFEWMEHVPNNPRVWYQDTGRAANDRKVPVESMNTVLSIERNRDKWIAIGMDKNWENLAYAIKAGFPIQTLEFIVQCMGGITDPNSIGISQYQKAVSMLDIAMQFAQEVGNNDANVFLAQLKDIYTKNMHKAEATARIMKPEVKKTWEERAKRIQSALKK